MLLVLVLVLELDFLEESRFGPRLAVADRCSSRRREDRRSGT